MPERGVNPITENTMKAINRNRLLASAGAALLALGCGSGKSADLFKVPVADWTGGAVTCEVINQIVEKEMGHKVKRITMPSGPAVSEGTARGRPRLRV